MISEMVNRDGLPGYCVASLKRGADLSALNIAPFIGLRALPKTHLFYRYRIMNGGTGMEDGAGME